MYKNWLNELWRVAAPALILLIIGLLSGHLIFVCLLGALAYAGWHTFNTLRLQRWLRDSDKNPLPSSRGIWGEIFDELHRLQVRNRKRKLKLTHMLNRFQEAAAALPDAVVMLTINGQIEWFNSAAQALLGLRWPQDVGQRIDNLVRHPSFIEFLAEKNYSKPVEMPSPAHEHILLEALIVPYGQEQRLLLAADITRIRRLEQVRRDFVANVSHELRTPLTVITGFLETMDEATDIGHEEWARSLHLMRQQTRRMQNLVSDLLLLSRLEMDEKLHADEIVAVADLLNHVVREAVALSAERNHRITLKADTALRLHGNSSELRSAFSNIIFNAVHYTPARGAIDVHWFQDDLGAHLEVRDSGEGIPTFHIPRLVERFYRVDAGRSRQSGGTGLGLAIVKHVLNHHAGVLRIQSDMGKGSTFTCDFPPSAISLATPAKAAAASIKT